METIDDLTPEDERLLDAALEHPGAEMSDSELIAALDFTFGVSPRQGKDAAAFVTKASRTPAQDRLGREVRAFAEPGERDVRAALRPIVTSYGSAVVRAARMRRYEPTAAYVKRAQNALKPIIERLVRLAISHARTGVARKASYSPGRYRYGRVDSAGGFRLNVDGLVRSRLANLRGIFGTIDARVRRRLGRRTEEGWDAEDIDDLIEDFDDYLADGGWVDTVAGTEAWGAINAARVAAMLEDGVQYAKWVTYEDERVRDTHVKYGKSRPRPMGFNYARLVMKQPTYRLRWPYDEDCTELGEFINCRCLLVEAEPPRRR